MIPNASFVDHDELSLSEFQQKGNDRNVQRSMTYNTSKQSARLKDTQPEKQVVNLEFKPFEPPKSNIQQTRTNKGPQRPATMVKLGSQQSDNVNLHSLSYPERGLSVAPKEIAEHKDKLNILDLTSNRFDQFPNEILQLSKLKVLRIDHNKIKTIPSGIGQLQCLECFTLSCNLVQYFPNTMSQLKNLKELNFEFNLIDNIEPHVVDIKSLQVMNMARNRFTQFPCTFYKMSGIVELTFEWFKYCNPPLSNRQRGKDGEQRIQKLRDALEKLAENGQKGVNFLEFLQLMSLATPKLDNLDDAQRSLLHYSALYEDVSVMKYMITNLPFLLDLADLEGHTPLSLSIIKEKYLSARYLLKHGANPVKGGGIYGSPLHLATRKLNFQIVRDIINRGENLNKIDSEGYTPLHHSMAMMSGGNPRAIAITQFLLENGVNPNAKNKEGWSPLHLAVRKKDLKTLQWIILYNREAQEVHGRDEVFNLNKRGGLYEYTPLHVASNTEAYEILEVLAQNGGDLFKRCLNGVMPKGLLRGYGITMKYVDKFEKSWIHRHILFRNEKYPDQLEDSNLKNLNSSKEIRNASKNKFDGSLSYHRDDHSGLMDRSADELSYLTYLNQKPKTFIPLMLTQKVMSKKHDDSFEIQPETETNDSFGETIEINVNKADFLSELNENVLVEAKVFSRESPVLNRNDTVKRVNHTRSPSKKRFTSGVAQFLGTDAAEYQKYLEKDAKFSAEFCKNEIKSLKESFQLDRLLFTDRLKIFTMLRLLFNKILDHIQKVLKLNLTKETFPLLSMKDTNAVNYKNTLLANSKRSEIYIASVLYDLVPQCLIDFYATLANNNYETSLFKNMIIRMFVEFRYYPAIDFLEAIDQKSHEIQFVKQEAQQAAQSLKNMYQVCVMNRAFNKDHKSLQQAPQNLKKPSSIKPQVNTTADENCHSLPFHSGPSFNAKAVFIPVKISDHIDKII